MAVEKHTRTKKRQFGQFFTPVQLASKIVGRHTLRSNMRVLEPGFGNGAFLFPLIEEFLRLRDGNLEAVLTENVWGVEIDPDLYTEVINRIERVWGALPRSHNLICGDYLDPRTLPDEAHASLFSQVSGFELVIGNPPVGGTVALDLQDHLERRFGRRHGLKIKRESYSLFIVKSLDLLVDDGVLEFICSDTFLTIPTMKGLRHALMVEGSNCVRQLGEFSDETSYPMVVLHHEHKKTGQKLVVNEKALSVSQVEETGTFSWSPTNEFASLFAGPKLSEYIFASSGMTTGKNEYFIRELGPDHTFVESFDFSFFDDPITVEREIERARIGKISTKKLAEIADLEAKGATRRNVRVLEIDPKIFSMPHPDYRYYNKAQPGRIFVPPKYVIFWKDEGDAVKTFKRNGNWYLHGVGGAPYFGREGLTWRLISSRLDMRYLPAGYILDSGAPCAFLRNDVKQEELWFILGWCVTDLASTLIKTVLNHTMNIQSKDVERLPYPWWVSIANKKKAISLVKAMVTKAQNGEVASEQELLEINELYSSNVESLEYAA